MGFSLHDIEEEKEWYSNYHRELKDEGNIRVFDFNLSEEIENMTNMLCADSWRIKTMTPEEQLEFNQTLKKIGMQIKERLDELDKINNQIMQQEQKVKKL